MGTSLVVFSATGDIQTFVVPATGGYLIEASGAQAPDPANAGDKGDRVKGMFYLNRGDILKIIVGSQCRADAPDRRLMCGEGGSIVWRGAGQSPLPARLLLAANGGNRGPSSAPEATLWAGSFNAGAFQSNDTSVHLGDGRVSIVSVSSSAAVEIVGVAPADAVFETSIAAG